MGLWVAARWMCFRRPSRATGCSSRRVRSGSLLMIRRRWWLGAHAPPQSGDHPKPPSPLCIPNRTRYAGADSGSGDRCANRAVAPTCAVPATGAEFLPAVAARLAPLRSHHPSARHWRDRIALASAESVAECAPARAATGRVCRCDPPRRSPARAWNRSPLVLSAPGRCPAPLPILV